MGRARSGAIIGVLATGGLLTMGLADCAEPTQIEIDVRTDGCNVVKNTGIAVSSSVDLDKAPLTIFTPRTEGCEKTPPDRIGTLVIYPSGAKDAEVAIRIVTGVTRLAQECAQGPYAGCIVARRLVRFVPGESKKIIVIMSRTCEGKDCGRAAECSEGQCVTVLPDGGLQDAGPAADSDIPEGSVDDSGDGGQPVLEAGTDACVGCEGPGKTCTDGNQCTIACAGGADCTAATVCGPGLDCTVQCSAANVCDELACNAPGGSCNIQCGVADGCKKIACNAPGCFVNCNGSNTCRDQISLTGGDAGIVCVGNDGCDQGGKAYCDAGRCQLTCNANSSGGFNCPTPRECLPAASCTGPWN
jgi:hypothetical protein